MIKLTVDWLALEEAFDNSVAEFDYCLDRQTGRVYMVTEESRATLEDVQEAWDGKDGDLEAALEDFGLSEFEKEQVRDANFVDVQWFERMIRVPRQSSHEAYRTLEAFIATVQDDQLQDRLWRAIEGRGAFRRFRDELGRSLLEEKRWHAFERNRRWEAIRVWLNEQGIEPANEPPEVGVDMAQMQAARRQLLAEVLAFTQAARKLSGVARIALIGSLTTDKPDPKDADMLVTIRDDMDLIELATLGRRLSGHAQSFGRGGEVFLADAAHNYLGRICLWKVCGPGIRAACDAWHCGRREYLHDDFGDVRLAQGLIARPPVVLWPAVGANVAVPVDLDEVVLRPLVGICDRAGGQANIRSHPDSDHRDPGKHNPHT